MAKNSKFTVFNHATGVTISEMQLWSPEQGESISSFPVELDVKFYLEPIRTQSHSLAVWAKEAEIKLVIEGGDVERGSRFGDRANREFEIVEIQDSDEKIMSSGVDGQVGIGSGGLESTSWFPKVSFSGGAKKGSRKTSQYSKKHTINQRKNRVTARPQNSWIIKEPVAPHFLDGNYLGKVVLDDSSEMFLPICRVSSNDDVVTVRAWLRIPKASLRVVLDDTVKGEEISRNKDAIIQQLVRRAKLSGLSKSDGQVVQRSSEYIEVGYAELVGESLDET